MKVEIISSFKLHGEIMLPGTVLDIPLEAFEKLEGKVAAVPAEPAAIPLPPRTECRACGHKIFRQGIGTHRSCERCQIPEHPHGMKTPGGTLWRGQNEEAESVSLQTATVGYEKVS